MSSSVEKGIIFPNCDNNFLAVIKTSNMSSPLWIPPGRDKRSGVWKDFLVSSESSARVKCKHCDKELTYHSSTSSMKYHLQQKHNISLASGSAPASTTVQSSITSHFPAEEKSTPEKVLASLAAVDRISFHTLATSKEIRKGWVAQGLKMPTTHQAIKGKVMAYGKEVEDQIKEDIARRKDRGEVFSITLDEWTSDRNRRYLGLNLHGHGEKLYGLGILRIKESFPAEKAAKVLEERLASYGLSLDEDIFGATTDGASVMQKLGRILDLSCHQMCHAHGLHLGVVQVKYNKMLLCLCNKNKQEILFVFLCFSLSLFRFSTSRSTRDMRTRTPQ